MSEIEQALHKFAEENWAGFAGPMHCQQAATKLAVEVEAICKRELKRQIEIQAATIEEQAKRLSKLFGSIVDLRNELVATSSPTHTMWIMAELERIGELKSWKQ